MLRKKTTICLILLSVGLFGLPLYELARLSMKVSLLSHVMLVPIVSLYLLWTQRKAIFSKLDYSPVIGIGLMVISLGVLGYQKLLLSDLNQTDAMFFAVSSMVIWIWGSFILLCGRNAFGKAMFPLLFLAYMIPIPALVLDPIVRFLQIGSTYATQGILRVLDVPAYFEGILITLPGITVKVAKECSGIRSALALMILTTVAGYLFLRSNWRRWLLVIFVVPVTIIKNGMRITTLTLMGAYVDISYITDSMLHGWGGKPFLLVAMIMMSPILWALRKSEKRTSGREESGDSSLNIQGKLGVSNDTHSV